MDLLTIAQRLLKDWNNGIAAASDHAALRLEIFGKVINRKFCEINY